MKTAHIYGTEKLQRTANDLDRQTREIFGEAFRITKEILVNPFSPKKIDWKELGIRPVT